MSDSTDDLVQSVLETIDTAKTHRIRLQEALDSLHEAKDQIQTSAQGSRQKLHKHFKDLKICINKALEDRFDELIAQVQDIENTSVDPLNQCEELIDQSKDEAMKVLEDGKKLLICDHSTCTEEMSAFRNRCNELGLNTVPEVPQLSDVPCIYIDLPRDTDAAEAQLVEAIRDYGKVIAKAPVQITSVQERPGSLLVKWNIVEDEQSLDLDEFLLEYSPGVIRCHDDESARFTAAYQGPATLHVVRHLTAARSYSFRVCGRVEGAPTWSPWSVPVISVTSVPHHQWEPCRTGDYAVSNENTLAEKTSKADVLLCSSTSSYICGHSIVFKILECGAADVSDGIGLLCKHPGTTDIQFGKGCLFVTTEGKVFMDGLEKTTQLPALSKGSTLTFDTEVLQQNKVRVTIDVDERNVIFDWPIDSEGGNVTPSSGTLGFMAMGVPEEKQVNLLFALKFTGNRWRVSVD